VGGRTPVAGPAGAYRDARAAVTQLPQRAPYPLRQHRLRAYIAIDYRRDPPARVLLDRRSTTPAHRRTPPGMLITFSGLDGAGKSTLIEWLRSALEEQRHRVAVLHLEHDVGVYAAVRRLREGAARLAWRRSGSAAPAASRGPIATLLRRIRHAVVWSKVVRRLIYPLDVAVFLCYRAYIEGIRGQVLIMDRYVYDILVDVSSERARWWIRWLERITPPPMLPLLCDA